MTQFLKKNAKLFYIILFVFSLFILISTAFYITEYSGVSVDYKTDIITGEEIYIKEGNKDLLSFLSGIKILGSKFDLTYKDYAENLTNKRNYDAPFAISYRCAYEFDLELQKVNNSLLSLGLFSLAMVAVMFICANASRKKYYISNLVSGIICPIATIAFTVVVLIQNLNALSFYNSHSELLNWVQLANKNNYVDVEQGLIHQASIWYANNDFSHFELSNFTLMAFTVIFIVFIVYNGLLIAYSVYRYLDTRKELSLERSGDECVN